MIDGPGPSGTLVVPLSRISGRYYISFGSTFDSALANLTLIFERLRSYGLQLKSTKCHLLRSSVPFLGHIVGRWGLECDPANIEDVKSWPVPDCLKSVRQFLGFVGYYRRFIPNFADIAMPLVTLTGKDVPFVWDAGVRPPSVFSGHHFYMPRSSLSRLKPDNTFLTQMLATLVWVECWARSRTLTATLLHHEARFCAPLSLCVSSSDLINVAPSSLSAQIIGHWSGYTGSRTRKVWWPGGFILYNSFNFPSYTNRVVIMVMQTDSPELAVAHRDLHLHVAYRALHVARRNVADLTGGVRAVLDDPQHWTVHPIQGVICLDGRALLLIRTLCLCARSYQNCIQTPAREITDCTRAGHFLN